eukprot:7259769-Pyramimonas_sp.AAC.1
MSSGYLSKTRSGRAERATRPQRTYQSRARIARSRPCGGAVETHVILSWPSSTHCRGSRGLYVLYVRAATLLWTADGMPSYIACDGMSGSRVQNYI